MSRKNIGKFSWGYELVRRLTITYHRLYYRKIRKVHMEKIPYGHPVIFTMNHQNALMDALSVVYGFPYQSVFMARADIFKKKPVARLLYFLKILPAYRIRDGFHSVDQNKEVFKEVINVIENNKSVALYPEGSHLGEKRLRQLKKGAARLAMMASEANGFSKEVFIVPVGLDYSNYYNAGSDLLIVVGDPMPVSSYKEQYLENQTLAINALTLDLAEALKKVMINIDSEIHYKTIKTALDIYAPIELKKQKLRKTLWNIFRVKKEMSDQIITDIDSKEKELSNLKKEIDQYQDKLKKSNIQDRQLSNPSGNSAFLILKSLLSLLLLPIDLYGAILNFIPYRLPIYLSRNIKDPHFISSVRFGLGILTFLPWYLIVIILSLIFINHILISLAFIVSVPLAGIIAFYHHRFLLKLRADFRWNWIRLRNKKLYEELTGLRKDIILAVEDLLRA